MTADFLLTEYHIEKLGAERQAALSESRLPVGLWMRASAARHACAANAIRTYYGDFLTVYAAEDINAGADVTVALWPAELTFPIRRQRSLARYGRECACALCAEDSADPHLLEQFELQLRFRQLEARREATALRDLATEQTALMEKRIALYGTRRFRPGIAEDAAVVAAHWAELGDDRMAVRYNRVAFESAIGAVNVRLFALFRIAYSCLRTGDTAAAAAEKERAEEIARTATGCTKEVFEMVYRADLSSYGIPTIESQ
jgi:hypothetical protein